MFSALGHLYGRVLIKRVWAGTECAIWEEQCRLRQGRGCMDQVFAVRQVCEEYLANGKVVFGGFMDLEKAFDTIYRHGIWPILSMYVVAGKLLKTATILCRIVDSRAVSESGWMCVSGFR